MLKIAGQTIAAGTMPEVKPVGQCKASVGVNALAEEMASVQAAEEQSGSITVNLVGSANFRMLGKAPFISRHPAAPGQKEGDLIDYTLPAEEALKLLGRTDGSGRPYFVRAIERRLAVEQARPRTIAEVLGRDKVTPVAATLAAVMAPPVEAPQAADTPDLEAGPEAPATPAGAEQGLTPAADGVDPGVVFV